MFNWTYAFLYALYGFIAAHVQLNPRTQGLGVLMGIGGTALIIIAATNFGLYWAFITFVEIIVGAILHGIFIGPRYFR